MMLVLWRSIHTQLRRLWDLKIFNLILVDIGVNFIERYGKQTYGTRSDYVFGERTFTLTTSYYEFLDPLVGSFANCCASMEQAPPDGIVDSARNDPVMIDSGESQIEASANAAGTRGI